IMEYIKKYLPMPEWVTVNPEKEEIYVAVTQMDIKSNFKVGIERIDLEANNLAFKIKVPYKTLGIDPPSDYKAIFKIRKNHLQISVDGFFYLITNCFIFLDNINNNHYLTA